MQFSIDDKFSFFGAQFKTMSTYVIGDVHGCLGALKALVAATDIKPGDTLIFLGDYISRGTDSKGVIDWILEHQSTYHIIALRGNHEIMMRRARKGKRQFMQWYRFGGESTLKSYGITEYSNWREAVPKSHWKFLKSTRSYYVWRHFVFVHAGLENGVPMHEQSKAALFWRKYPKPEKYSEDAVVICGHTPRKDGRIADFGHAICLDTYAYGGKWLSCLHLPSGRFWQAREKGKTRKGILPGAMALQ
ncbi:MAG: serine/threonine protein phosphatase [Cryomorphaceae bacterium]|nr:MAG: serine/threonine protein phosphatase [Cryomorphaceae bacterium]